MLEKEVVKYAVELLREAMVGVEDELEKKITKMIHKRIIEPLDLLRQRIMFGFTATLLLSFGLLSLALGLVVLIMQTVSLWQSLLLGGVILSILGAFFFMKMMSLKPYTKEEY